MDPISSRSRTTLLPTTYCGGSAEPPRPAPQTAATSRAANTVDVFSASTPSTLVAKARTVSAIAPAIVSPPATSITKAEGEQRVSAQGLLGDIGDALLGVGERIVDGVSGVVTGVYDSVVGTLKNTWEMAETFGKGIVNIFTGRFGEGFAQLGLSILKAVQTPTDGLLRLGGSVLSAIQTLLFIEPVGRKLTGEEMAALHAVYGDSIDYTKIQLKEGNAGLLTVGGRPFTHGDTIYVPEGWLPLTPDTLVHEAAHVWQHQHGGNDYMSEALAAQLFGDGYKFEKALREGKAWEEMNPEQQAEMLEQAYAKGCFKTPPAPFIVDGRDYSAQLAAAMKSVHAGQGAP
ncbi:hypothetical protein OV208_15250 [Corallococcus sp. bb12-1]|uniref:hypothetical protein n=1 Tax=Corallococcus sp. bb12-1 TaxID=2996784 RepID=UPI0022700186|nr:hypothetical protein [Corallococcus sp. bb12-1]MCY1042680.1 hypothetical protein [Corallococcus sp. bb12-1]